MKNLRILGLIAALSLGASMVATDVPVGKQPDVKAGFSSRVTSTFSNFGQTLSGTMRTVKSGVQNFVTKTGIKENAKGLFEFAKHGFGTCKDASVKFVAALKSKVVPVCGSFMSLIKSNPKTSWTIGALMAGGALGLELKHIANKYRARKEAYILGAGFQEFENEQQDKEKQRNTKRVLSGKLTKVQEAPIEENKDYSIKYQLEEKLKEKKKESDEKLLQIQKLNSAEVTEVKDVQDCYKNLYSDNEKKK